MSSMFALRHKETGEVLLDVRGKHFHTVGGARNASNRVLAWRAAPRVGWRGWRHWTAEEKDAFWALKAAFEVVEMELVAKPELEVLREKAARYDDLNK